jgi:hypothetical protein
MLPKVTVICVKKIGLTDSRIVGLLPQKSGQIEITDSIVVGLPPIATAFDRVYLATGLLLPIWDKLPDDYVRVSRIAVKEGQSMIGREVPHIYVPKLMAELGIDAPINLDINAIANLVL